jgi:hypothetical protein
MAQQHTLLQKRILSAVLLAAKGSHTTLSSSQSCAAVDFTIQAQLHAGCLVSQLLKLVVELGATDRSEENRASIMTPMRQGVALMTSFGRTRAVLRICVGMS